MELMGQILLGPFEMRGTKFKKSCATAQALWRPIQSISPRVLWTCCGYSEIMTLMMPPVCICGTSWCAHLTSVSHLVFMTRISGHFISFKEAKQPARYHTANAEAKPRSSDESRTPVLMDFNHTEDLKGNGEMDPCPGDSRALVLQPWKGAACEWPWPSWPQRTAQPALCPS